MFLNVIRSPSGQLVIFVKLKFKWTFSHDPHVVSRSSENITVINFTSPPCQDVIFSDWRVLVYGDLHWHNAYTKFREREDAQRGDLISPYFQAYYFSEKCVCGIRMLCSNALDGYLGGSSFQIAENRITRKRLFHTFLSLSGKFPRQ
jgi:hypothetical protein